MGENGSSVVGKFRLTSEPRESVTLELSGGVGEVSFSSSTLTFNASNWANYQFVTLPVLMTISMMVYRLRPYLFKPHL